MDIPAELVEEFAKGSGVIFVGPGLSQESGMPSAEELLSELSIRLGVPSHLRTSLPKVSQYYEQRYNRQALLQYIITKTDTYDKKPANILYHLIRLGARTWITTNCDDLLERVFYESGERFIKIVRDENLPYTSSDSIALVKLHGDREQPDTIVFTQQDYQTYFRRFPRIKEKVANLLLEKTFLFVGYESDNPAFDQILAEISLDLKQHQRKAYAILIEADQFTIEDLASRNIRVLSLVKTDQKQNAEVLDGFLDELINQIDQIRQRARTSSGTVDETVYREWLREETDTIDIRGIGNRNAPGRFPLFELYVPLYVREISSTAGRGKTEERISLEKVLIGQKHAIVVGGPGSGKTTFLRYLARKAVDDPTRPLPLFMRASNLYEYLTQQNLKQNECSYRELVNYWFKRNESQGWGFRAGWFQNQLQQGRFQLLLDGLDELPDETARQQVTKIIDSSVEKWPKCKWIVTSRPTVYQSFTPLNFSIIVIDELEDSDIQKFVHAWVNILYHGMLMFSEPNTAYPATRYEQELLQAIKENIDVKLLARNPVMLTAIAVMHWNNMKLPEGKAELYKTIIDWLIRARRDYPQKPNEKVALDCYQRLALAMFNHAEGVQTSVGRAWAAEQIADLLPNPDQRDKNKIALEFLEYEEVNTGIVVGREGGNVAFWHVSFQEYLAAYEIATKTDDEATGWWSFLKGNLFNPQWIEVLRFVPTIFFVSLGRGRVDLFVKRILATRKGQSLTETARVVGLLGSVLLDLSVYHYAVDRVEEYLSARDQVMHIFSQEKLAIDFQTRYDVAVALGHWGDPRLSRAEQNWIWIPRGIATIGAQAHDLESFNFDEFALPGEGPVFETYSASFEIGRFPVTVQEYRQFVTDHGYEVADFWSVEGWEWCTRNNITKPNHWEDQLEYPNKPVTYVGWFEARAYCHWLTSRDRNMIYRLPTGNEWEYMARRKKNVYQRYVFGDITPAEVNEEMNCDRSGSERLTPVGLFPLDSTIDNVMDVNGNIWEWVQDIGEQQYTSGIHQASLVQKVDSNLRYRRGGGWHDTAAQHRTAIRSRISAQNRYDDTGFRVLRRYAPVPIKGKVPNPEFYVTSLADVYARYSSRVYSWDETNDRFKKYAHRFALPVDCSLIQHLFPNKDLHPSSLSERPLPILDQVPKEKFEFNLYYQDSRVKLAVEEKLGAQADAAESQSQALDLLEVIASLLSAEGLAGRAVWQDLTDNDLDGLTVMVLDRYDPHRIEHLLDVGYMTNERAMAGLPRLEGLTFEKLIQYQIFAGTVWWMEKGATLTEQFPSLGKVEIDDRTKFKQEVLGGKCNIIFFFDDNGELIWDLALILQLLQMNPQVHVTGVVSSQVVFNNSNVQTINKCLESRIFLKIKESQRFELFVEDSPRPALDPLFCSKELTELMKAADLAFLKGVALFEIMQNLPVDAYYAFVVHSLDSQICTGLKAGSGVFVRIPRGRYGYRYQKQSLKEIYTTL